MGMNNGKYKNGETVKKIIEALKNGSTDKEAFMTGGISRETFYAWIREYPEFSDAVKMAREEARENRIAQLEASLYKRAMGYTVKEKKSELVANPNGGAPILVKQTIIEKDVAGDTAAIIFGLTNGAPDKWKNKLNTEHTGEVDTGMTFIIESEKDKELIEKMVGR